MLSGRGLETNELRLLRLKGAFQPPPLQTENTTGQVFLPPAGAP